MTRNEALIIARNNMTAYHVADFGFMMGRNARPNPADYGRSGTVDKPGGHVTEAGFMFDIYEVCPQTAPIHAGI